MRAKFENTEAAPENRMRSNTHKKIALAFPAGEKSGIDAIVC